MLAVGEWNKARDRCQTAALGRSPEAEEAATGLSAGIDVLSDAGLVPEREADGEREGGEEGGGRRGEDTQGAGVRSWVKNSRLSFLSDAVCSRTR